MKARAGWRCEGSPAAPSCRLAHGALGGRDRDGVWYPALPLGESGLRLQWPQPRTLAWCHGYSEPLRIFRIVLTVGHLDHTPENCAMDNLRAWCQRCHLVYDAAHHAQTRAATRRKGLAIGDLLE